MVLQLMMIQLCKVYLLYTFVKVKQILTILLFAAAIVYFTPAGQLYRFLSGATISLVTDADQAGGNEKEDDCYQKQLLFQQAAVQLYTPFLLCKCPKVPNPVVLFSIHPLKIIPTQPPEILHA